MCSKTECGLIRRLLDVFMDHHFHRCFGRRATHLDFRVGVPKSVVDHSRELPIVTTQVPVDRKLPITVVPKDDEGATETLDGSPTILSSDPTVATIVPGADDLNFFVVPTGKLGTTTITASADAQIGPGEHVISGSLDVEFVPAEATVLNLEPGTPVPLA